MYLRVIGLIWVMLVLLVVALPIVRAEVVPNKETILQSWKQRGERVRSAEFVWNERQTYAKGSIRKTAQLTLPPEDVTFERPVTLVFDGNKMRYTYQTKEWNSTNNEFVTQDYTNVFDGVNNKLFWPEGLNSTARVP